MVWYPKQEIGTILGLLLLLNEREDGKDKERFKSF